MNKYVIKNINLFYLFNSKNLYLTNNNRIVCIQNTATAAAQLERSQTAKEVPPATRETLVRPQPAFPPTTTVNSNYCTPILNATSTTTTTVRFSFNKTNKPTIRITIIIIKAQEEAVAVVANLRALLQAQIIKDNRVGRT